MFGIARFLRQSPGPCSNTKCKRDAKGQEPQKDFCPVFILGTALKNNELGQSVYRTKLRDSQLGSIVKMYILLPYSSGYGTCCGICHVTLSEHSFN